VLRTERLVPALTAVVVLLFVVVGWDVPAGVLVQGAIVGGLSALLALGLAVVWRANRVIDFAAGDLGAVPATLAVLLTVSTVGLGWWGGLAVGLATALALGAVVELVIIRRFTSSPRLVLTVATIGLAQLLAAGALLLPRLFTLPGNPVPDPIDAHITIDPITFGGSDIVAAIVIPLVFLALALFFTRSEVGIAVRAGAERADRALMLGIPVRRLQTIVWMIATVLAFLAVFLRAGIVGLPIGEVLGPAILLRALAAAVIGRMERLPTIAGAAIMLGIIEQSVIWHWREPDYVDPILFVVVLVALLVTHVRSDRTPEPSAWQAVREVRPIPRELARLTEVRVMRRGAVAVGSAVLLAVPLFLSESRTNLAAAIVVFAIIGISLVLLTGWAGQVSLGQMAFVGIGAAVAGAATARLGWDLVPAIVLAGLVGAGVALVIGLPALRRRGLTLAVTSLAFALATSSWLLNRSFFGPGHALDWLPSDRIARPDLFGVSLSSETRMYYVCLGGLALAFVAALGLRRTRTGRALVAVRDNERGGEAFGVHAHRITLFAFAASGFLAAFAGALLVHQQSGLTAGPYRPEESLAVFTMAVIGGLGSIPGAILGAAYVRSVDYYFAQEWQILATGAGLLIVLWLFPGGLGGAFADLRDAFLRRVARRHALSVPSLVPDAPTDSGHVEHHTLVSNVPNSPEGALLQVHDLDVAFDGVRVLHGIDVAVEAGEVVALLGTNGAGKSTVLRAIAGTAAVTGGSIVFDGDDVSRVPADVRARRGIVSAPGDAGTFPGLTVREHLRLAAWATATPTAWRDALDRIPELAERLDDRAGDLSGGQQQMVNVAMALVAKPRLLLLDELSLGLAPAVVTRLLDIVRELGAAGTTIVLVEQSIPLALRVAERAYFLEKGQVRFVGPTRELLERPDLVRAVLLEHATPTAAGSGQGDRRPPAEIVPDRRTGAVRMEVRGVSKRFGGVVALDDVSFDVHDREILGVLGPNGAGKTTLFDVLSGFVAAERGRVVLHRDDGTAVDLDRRSPASRAQAGLGRSFQDARLFPALTSGEAVAVAGEDQVAVRDPVAAALHLPVVSRSERTVEAHVDELLERFGVSSRRTAFVRELSTGTRRVLDLACVTAAEPRVLLLDEPSAGIARAETDALAPLLRRLRDEQGVTLVVIEHDLALLQAVCDRVIALDVGTVIAQGSPDAVVRDPAVVSAYVGKAP